MQKGLFAAALLATVVSFGQVALAEGGFERPSKEQMEKFKSMSPEEREKFHAERKAQWDAMPTAEKVKVIEKARAERRKESDERWKNFSDEEKVKYVEERMEKKRKFHEEGGFHKEGGPKGPPPHGGKPFPEDE